MNKEFMDPEGGFNAQKEVINPDGRGFNDLSSIDSQDTGPAVIQKEQEIGGGLLRSLSNRLKRREPTAAEIEEENRARAAIAEQKRLADVAKAAEKTANSQRKQADAERERNKAVKKQIDAEVSNTEVRARVADLERTTAQINAETEEYKVAVTEQRLREAEVRVRALNNELEAEELEQELLRRRRVTEEERLEHEGRMAELRRRIVAAEREAVSAREAAAGSRSSTGATTGGDTVEAGSSGGGRTDAGGDTRREPRRSSEEEKKNTKVTLPIEGDTLADKQRSLNHRIVQFGYIRGRGVLEDKDYYEAFLDRIDEVSGVKAAHSRGVMATPEQYKEREELIARLDLWKKMEETHRLWRSAQKVRDDIPKYKESIKELESKLDIFRNMPGVQAARRGLTDRDFFRQKGEVKNNIRRDVANNLEGGLIERELAVMVAEKLIEITEEAERRGGGWIPDKQPDEVEKATQEMKQGAISFLKKIFG